MKLPGEVIFKEVEAREAEVDSDLEVIEVASKKVLPHTLFPMALFFINRKAALL